MTTPVPAPVPNHKRYFFDKFGITERLLERCLGEALSAGGDYADLYFESVTAIGLGKENSGVRTAEAYLRSRQSAVRFVGRLHRFASNTARTLRIKASAVNGFSSNCVPGSNTP